jgi:hypothetical protein
MPRSRPLVLGLLPGWLASAALVSGASAADRRYDLHFTAVLCVIAPCPDWQAIDRETGEKFQVMVDFSRLPRSPSQSNDLLVEARRETLPRPGQAGTYERLVVISILKSTPSVPGYRP